MQGNALRDNMRGGLGVCLEHRNVDYCQGRVHLGVAMSAVVQDSDTEALMDGICQARLVRAPDQREARAPIRGWRLS